MLRWEGSERCKQVMSSYIRPQKHPLSPARSRPGISRIEKLQFKFLTNTKRITLYSRDVQLARNLTPNWTEFDRISLNWFLLDLAASAWHLVGEAGPGWDWRGEKVTLTLDNFQYVWYFASFISLHIHPLCAFPICILNPSGHWSLVTSDQTSIRTIIITPNKTFVLWWSWFCWKWRKCCELKRWRWILRAGAGGRRVMGQIRFSLQSDPNVSCQQLAVILGTDSIKHPKLRMSGFQSSHFQICKLSFTEALIVTVWEHLYRFVTSWQPQQASQLKYQI